MADTPVHSRLSCVLRIYWAHDASTTGCCRACGLLSALATVLEAASDRWTAVNGPQNAFDQELVCLCTTHLPQLLVWVAILLKRAARLILQQGATFNTATAAPLTALLDAVEGLNSSTPLLEVLDVISRHRNMLQGLPVLAQLGMCVDFSRNALLTELSQELLPAAGAVGQHLGQICQCIRAATADGKDHPKQGS